MRFGKLHNSQKCWVTKQANVQFDLEVSSGSLSVRLVVYIDSATKTSARKVPMAVSRPGRHILPHYDQDAQGVKWLICMILLPFTSDS